jgi:Cof subfamily protein (haloacid dehalogenase superfamily)
MSRCRSSGRVSIKLLISDVDGTLVDKEKRLSPETIAAVGRLRAAGIGFTVISARPRSGVAPLVDALGLDGPAAAFNGGLIFAPDGSTIARHAIARDVAGGVLAAASDAPVDIWVFADDRWHATRGDGPHTASERRAANQEPVVRTDFADLTDRADKITLVSDDPPVLARLLDRLRAEFGGNATIAMSQTYYLDVTAPEANKGAGVEALASAFGAALAETAVIGDQHNDLPMLERAGLAIAMGNAPDAVKAAAGHVTATNEADGVAAAIDRWILSSS